MWLRRVQKFQDICFQDQFYGMSHFVEDDTFVPNGWVPQPVPSVKWDFVDNI